MTLPEKQVPMVKTNATEIATEEVKMQESRSEAH